MLHVANFRLQKLSQKHMIITDIITSYAYFLYLADNRSYCKHENAENDIYVSDFY